MTFQEVLFWLQNHVHIYLIGTMVWAAVVGFVSITNSMKAVILSAIIWPIHAPFCIARWIRDSL